MFIPHCRTVGIFFVLAPIAMAIVGTSFNANATETVNAISGMQSPVDGACVAAIPATGGFDCSYDASDPIGTGAQWSGPIVGAGYYTPGTSPYATGGIGDQPMVGDAKLSVPLYAGSEIRIEDNGSPCSLDDSISGIVILSAATRAFAGAPGQNGEETWEDGAIRIPIPATTVTTAQPDGAGGCRYEIASRGFPPLLDVAAGGQYPQDVVVAPGTYLAPGIIDVFCGTNGGGMLGSLGNGTEGNCGVETTAEVGFGQFPNITGWSCQDNTNPSQVATCGVSAPNSGACDLNGEHYCGARNALENLLISVSTDANSRIIWGTIYVQNELRIFNVGPPSPDRNSWWGYVISFTGDGVSHEPLGGSASGLIIDKVSCKNKTTGQKVTIQVDGTTTIWDCEQAGLAVDPGDEVSMKSMGSAE